MPIPRPLPSMLGMGCRFRFRSASSALPPSSALQVADPSSWLIQLGGPLYGCIALPVHHRRQISARRWLEFCDGGGPGSRCRRWPASWRTVLMASFRVAIVGVFPPDLFFDNFPACSGVHRRFLRATLRHSDRRLSATAQAADQHSRHLSGRSWHPVSILGGFNPAGILGMVAGSSPISICSTRSPMPATRPISTRTASLPTACVGGAVYWLATVLIVRPANPGDYRRHDRTTRSRREPAGSRRFTATDRGIAQAAPGLLGTRLWTE